MAAAPGAIDYPFAEPPAPGTATEVAAGIFWVRLPLPFALDHVNVYLIAEDDGWTLIDTGIDAANVRELWDAVIADRLGGARGARALDRIVVTHFHPDHVGLAGWLGGRFGAELWMTRTEWLMARMFALEDTEAWTELFIDFYRAAGSDRDFLEHTRRGGNPYARLVSPIPTTYRRLEDGDVVAMGAREWRVIVGEGHSPEHACLYSPADNVLLAGDQVLPRISPIVGVHAPEPDANPLAAFLASIDRLRRALPADALVLPAHNEPFTGLHARLDGLAAHHEARLARLADACARPRTTVELADMLFDRELDAHQMGFAIAETLSHLRVLEARGAVARAHDADGIWRFAQR